MPRKLATTQTIKELLPAPDVDGRVIQLEKTIGLILIPTFLTLGFKVAKFITEYL